MKPKPSNLEDHVGYWLRSLSNRISHSFAQRLEKHGTSVPQWVVLRMLYDHPSLSLNELGSRIGVDQGALSRMIERMMERGWVDRKENPQNRREVAISLTRKGKTAVPSLAREADENDRAFFAPLSEQQQKDFLATIKTLLLSNRDDRPGIPID